MIDVTYVFGSGESIAAKLKTLLNENWSIIYIGKSDTVGLFQAILKREETL